MKRALVTGASGFIGAHVVAALLREDVEVRALVLPGDPAPNLAGLPIERVHGDVTDAAALARAMVGVDTVFHLAAIYALWLRDPARMRAVNVEGTRAVLEAAARASVARVVHTSSIARFGGQGLGVRATEHSAFALGDTGDAYAQSKADAHAVAEAAAARGQDVVLVAPTGPIGPGDVGPTPTGRLLLLCAKLPVVAVPRSISNFADVRTIAQGHVLAARHGRAGRSYLLGDCDLSFAQIAELALAAVGRSAPVYEVPTRWVGLAARAMTAWADRVSHRAPPVTPAAVAMAARGLAADCSRARDELGLRPLPIERAVADALEDFRRRGLLRRSVQLPARGR